MPSSRQKMMIRFNSSEHKTFVSPHISAIFGFVTADCQSNAMKLFILSSLAALCCVASVEAYSFNTPKAAKPSDTSRRSLLLGGAALAAVSAIPAAPASAANLGDPKTVVGREIRSFNDLIYNFKNTALNGGLDASKLKEPSVPFIEFGERMKNGEVAFVEFMAPNGDVAYATFKPKKGQSKKKQEPIRIGQGYPTTGKDSWSSPDYVIRSVSNFGVPYKFTVPALAKYSTKK